MKHYKSERLKKIETELNDLEQWLKLGLVPKRDLNKHKEEIRSVRAKIEEEKERLQFLKETGEMEEYTAPKKTQTRAGYTEMPSLPDVDMAESTMTGSYHESTSEMETEPTTGTESGTGANKEEGTGTDHTMVEEESYFSDKNRWRRGSNIIDPDADEW